MQNTRVKEKVHPRMMRSGCYENRQLKAIAFCTLLAVSTLLPNVDGLKFKSRGKISSSSSSSSSSRASKPSSSSSSTSSSSSFSNPGSLSYSNYQAKPAPKPSAPVEPSNQRNIGWNVNSQSKPAGSVAQPAVNKPPYPVQTSAAKPPYPVQQQNVPMQASAAKPPYPVQQTNAAKPLYPVQATHNTHQTHAGAPPPPYSQGPPPPYSPVNNPNLNSRFNEQPPMYNPGNQGFRPGQPGFGQPGSFGQPAYGQPMGGFGQPMGGYGQPMGGYGQPMGGFGGGSGYHPPAGGFSAPHGTFQGGGYAPPVNYAPAPSFPIAAIPVGAYKPQSSGIGVGGIAAGVGTGLLAGAAGSALYNALRPEDRGRYSERGGVTIINNIPAAPAAAPAAAEGAVSAAAAPVPVAAAPASVPGVAPVPDAPAVPPVAGVPPVIPVVAGVPPVIPVVAGVTPVPSPAAGPDGQASVPLAPMPNATDDTNAQASSPSPPGVPDAPIILNQNATTMEGEQQQPAANGTDTLPPLAPVETAPTETTTVNPNVKQYIPPPGQYYPATGQYVPPGEYDPATGIFTPGRYIPDTSIFQSGLYDPQTQMFTPGRFETDGQFTPDPNHPPLSLAPNGGTAEQAVTPAVAPVVSQPEPVTPAVASQLKTTSGASMKTVSLLTALGALIVSEGFRQIVRF